MARGYATAADAARAYGWNEATYTSHENGTRRLRQDVAERYARAYGISAAELMGLKASKSSPIEEVSVIGRAEIGIWRDRRLDDVPSRNRQLDIAVPAINGTGGGMRFAIEVCDDSVNRSLQRGDYAICVGVAESDVDDLADGALVWVSREVAGLVEKSIRRVERSATGDGMVLRCHSRDGRFDDAIAYPPSADNETVSILGRVLARYSPL